MGNWGGMLFIVMITIQQCGDTYETLKQYSYQNIVSGKKTVSVWIQEIERKAMSWIPLSSLVGFRVCFETCSVWLVLLGGFFTWNVQNYIKSRIKTKSWHLYHNSKRMWFKVKNEGITTSSWISFKWNLLPPPTCVLEFLGGDVTELFDVLNW